MRLFRSHACLSATVGHPAAMTVELPPAPSRALSQLLKAGVYSSPAQAVAEGLRLLQQLLVGVNQVRDGKVAPFDEAAAARIKARGRKLLAAERRVEHSSGR